MLRNLNPTMLDAEDQVCTWGSLQLDFYRSLNPSCSHSMKTTGHPRFDLYKPKYREYFRENVEAIKKQYGDFLLVNTNFHRANTVEGLKKIFSNRVQSFTSADRYYLLERWLHINRVLTDFVTVITTLSTELPELNVVIRPHPSENPNFYRMIFSGVKNVHISQEGSVGPWLLACRAMMHDGCTTAIEGHMCDTQVINYKTVTDERFDIPLPNLFGVRCHSPSQALEMMRGVLRGETLTDESELSIQKKKQVATDVPQFIANFPVEKEAFDAIVPLVLQSMQTLPSTLQPDIQIDKKSTMPIINMLRGKRHSAKRKKQ